jgi:hypothetical protein
MSCFNSVEKLKLAYTGDIHLGMPSVSTDEIIEKLYKYCVCSKVFSVINMFVIGGDLFDILLKTNSPEYSSVVKFAYRVLDLARLHNVVVRVLEGTPSHDNKQSKVFEDIAMSMNKSENVVDFKYVQDLSIEFLPKFGLTALYVPDEWRDDCAITFEQVLQKMQEMGLDKVDYAFMHGQFEYQLPDVVKPHLLHKENDYAKIIKKACFISHIHTHTEKNFIYAPGSFDRLRHGEPEDKGFFIAEDTCVGVDVEFVVNVDAFKFVTLNCNHDDIADSLAYIQAKLNKLKPGARINIVTSTSSALYKNQKVLSNKFLGYHFTVNVKENKSKNKKSLSLPEIAINPIIINKNTITDLLHTKIKAVCTDKNKIYRALDLLKNSL